MKADIRGILLDIEGTTSSIRFVYDEMFPFVRRGLDRFLAEQWDQPAVQDAVRAVMRDSGRPELAESSSTLTPDELSAEVIRQMDLDMKATGLKTLQGLIWKSGFVQGDLVAHVYDDVLPAIRVWRATGVDVRIYSSGSVAAQRLFFGHTAAGNVLDLFSGHYDTTLGSKREATSYVRIAEDFGSPATELLFLSDVVAELDAARSAGWQTGLVVRPGNAEIVEPQSHPVFHSFDEIELVGA